MKRRIISVLLALAMLLSLAPAAGAAGAFPSDNDTWKNISKAEATSMLGTIGSKSATEDILLVYYRDTCGYSQSYVPQFIELCGMNGMKLYGYNDNAEGGLSAIWRYLDSTSITFPVVVAYNSETGEYASAHSMQGVSDFIDLLDSVGLYNDIDQLESSGYRSSGIRSMPKLSAEEVVALAHYDEMSADDAYLSKPSVQYPYYAGKLSEAAVQSGIDYLNGMRTLAGLPPVENDTEYEQLAQNGAMLLAANNTLSHYPPQPSDMADELYELGVAGTSQSNIAYTSSRTGSLPYFVNMWLDDSDYSNVSRLGHRRWLLNPAMGATGFGMANAVSGSTYSAVYSFDGSVISGGYDFIGWPASGCFPGDIFDSDCAWSVSLNPTFYNTPNYDSVRVTLTRESDGRTWVLNSSDGGRSSSSGRYFNIDRSGYGISNCIIFRPDMDGEYSGLYTVNIEGLETSTSKPVTDFTYQVEFITKAEVTADDDHKEDEAPSDTLGAMTAADMVRRDKILAMKGEYPEGMSWTNDNYYGWSAGVFSGGYGCSGFAMAMSDAAYGTAPKAVRYDEINYDALRVGDIVRINGDTHSIVVLEKYEDHIVATEGNYNRSVHWGREFTRDFILGADYYMTRNVSDTFPDVAESEWYFTYVQKAAAAGLLKGNTDGTFAPKDELSLAQAVTLAARLHAERNDEDDPTAGSGSPWYKPAYDYCVLNGVIDPVVYPMRRMEQSATRFEMVEIFDGALDEFETQPLTDNITVPDLSPSAPYSEIVYRWYKAGIVQGDTSGSFNGSTPIIRAEVATILCRVEQLAARTIR